MRISQLHVQYTIADKIGGNILLYASLVSSSPEFQVHQSLINWMFVSTDLIPSKMPYSPGLGI